MRRAFSFEPLEGRSLLSGDGFGATYEPAWTAPVATALPPVETTRDALFSASPQRLMTAAMWGRLLLPSTFDVSTFDVSAFDSAALGGALFGSTTFAGIGSEANRFSWPKPDAFFGPQFESIVVSLPQVGISLPYFGEPLVAKALFVDSASGAGMFCVVVCSSSPSGETSASISVSRFSLTDRGGDRFLRIDRAFDALSANDLSVFRVTGLSPRDGKPHDAWIADGAVGFEDASRYFDFVARDPGGDGNLVAGRERPLGGLPVLAPPAIGGTVNVGRGGDESHGYYAGGDEGGFIGLSTMSDFAPSVTNAFTDAVERAATNGFAQLAPRESSELGGFDAAPETETPFTVPGALDADQTTAAPPAIGPSRVVGTETDAARGSKALERSITRSDSFPAASESGSETATRTTDTDSNPATVESRPDPNQLANAADADPAATVESDAEVLAQADGEGGLIALAVSELPSEPITVQAAAEPWFVEDARPRDLATSESPALESSVGLFQVFDVAAALPAVTAAHEKLDSAPHPTFAMASLFPSISGLSVAGDEAHEQKPADSHDARVEEATVDSNMAIAAASAVVLSAGLSLRRKGPVAKLRAIFERWPRRKNRRAKRDA